MTADDVVVLLTGLLAGKKPTMPENCINDWSSDDKSRRLHEASGANAKTSVGAVVDLHRTWGYPYPREFASRYLRSGESFDKLRREGGRPDPRVFGRSASELAGIIANLTSYCVQHPNRRDAVYTEAGVGEWLLFLVIVRTAEGGHRERRVWSVIGGSLNGWRSTTYTEDTREGIDFVQGLTGAVVQVKPTGWHHQAELLVDWLRVSAMHGNRRWLVECDPLDGGHLDVHRVEMGTLVPASVEDLLRDS